MKEIENWFTNWWLDLPKHHFTSQNKGSKAECWKEIQKLNPDKELRDKIDWHTRELALRTAKLKQKDMRVPGWKHAVRLIRYRFWEDDLPSVMTEQQKSAGAKCSCGAPVDIADGHNKCWRCYGWPDRFKSDRKAALDRLGLGVPGRDSTAEQRRQWQQRCRTWCQSNAGRVLGKVVGGGA